jgi:hypothetical protein
MNNKQKEIVELIIEIFSNLRLDVKYLYIIKEKFNVLSSDDHEWSEIEDHVIEIIKKLDKIHE